MSSYEFTNSWFDAARSIWDQLIPQIKPKRILEIGSYEGASACYLIDKIGAEYDCEIHCVDTWEGGIEHKEGGSAQVDMSLVESRFNRNIDLAIKNAEHFINLFVYKKFSDECLATMLSEGKKNYFDLIYIDGSHMATDVISDAILSFKLLKVGGFMFFDDYLWYENLPHGKDPICCPKFAIDSFTNIFFRKINILSVPLYQMYIKKISD